MSNKKDETYEKPARSGQWQEKSKRPVAARPMDSKDIEDHKFRLLQSYDCTDESDIVWDFFKIKDDDDDEDRDDCLLLVYKLKCFDKDMNPWLRPIFTIKVPIPQNLKEKAEKLNREKMAKQAPRRKRLALLAPDKPSKQVEDVTSNVVNSVNPNVANTTNTSIPMPVIESLTDDIDCAAKETAAPVVTRPKPRKPIRVAKK